MNFGKTPQNLEEEPLQTQGCAINFLFDVEDLHALPEAQQLEFLEVECCLDTA